MDEVIFTGYAVVDHFLDLYLEQDQSIIAMVEQGVNNVMIEKVMLVVERKEYMVVQSAIGLRINKCRLARGLIFEIRAHETLVD